MKQLKTTLILNALSSGMTGLLLICLAKPVAGLNHNVCYVSRSAAARDK